MNDSFFLDTNIFVYSFDNKEPGKRKRAQELIRAALEGRGTTSWQVLQEFSNVALHKFEKPMGRDDLKEYLQTVLFPLCTVWPEETLYQGALSVGLETGYRWYDSLILASALKSNAAVLYSEDLQHDRVYRSIRIRNPFFE
ncbi:MAG TPA: PIN domain-containing protein [Sediminispirochaeta sp.]|nr:PIN domain-containing protein [Sediminispirochaeta sp.]